jgi:hypothetical protein
MKNIFEQQDVTYVPIDKWPKEIRDIALFQKGVEDIHPIIFKTTSNTNALGLMAGSGFGHWGIIVCPDTNSIPLPSGEIVAWENGVYFWLD